MNTLFRPVRISSRRRAGPSFHTASGSDAIPDQIMSIGRLCLRRLWVIIFLLGLFCGPDFAATAHGAEPVEIVVEGVVGDGQKNVLAALSLPPGLVADGKVDKLWLERFVRQADQKVVAALEPFGYYSAEVTVTLETPTPDTFRVRVKVEAGAPVIVTDVRVSVIGGGASESSLKALASAFPLQKGSLLQHQPYEEAKQRLQARAQELGYLDAEYTVHEIRIDTSARTGRIDLVLQTGERYFFSDITFEGAPDYPDTFLRRYLTFAAGDVFSQTKLAESQLQLNNSERFREVTLLAEKPREPDHKIPVRILLKPLPRRSLRPGIGYGTDTGARFALRYRDLNMLRKGHELDSNLYISERLQGLATAYILPSDRDVRTFTSVRINLQKENITTYESRVIALELGRTNSFGNQKLGTAYVKFQQEEFTIGIQDSTSRYVLPGVRFSDNHYDNLVRPTRGFRYALDLRGTHPVLGSTTQLMQLIGEASHILPIPWRLSLQTSAKAGITFFSDPIDDLPPSLRFFAGGDQSVRGYAYQSLGPRDSLGNVVGGKHFVTGCVEVQRAIFEDWAVSVFYNAGNAFDSFADITLFQAAGVGLHYFTPVGALNLSLARQIAVDDPGYRVHFTVGFEF
ncbi:MAG: outer membrane protein assembly factor [Deltaproteobacteria bacterium]|nr:outer membrane protein assembly factor [Deltaproteobacteria bacterium]